MPHAGTPLFENQHREQRRTADPVEGDLPEWLRGALLHKARARLEQTRAAQGLGRDGVTRSCAGA